MMRIYLAAPLFTQVQRAWNRTLAEAIFEAIDTASVILPQNFKPAGAYNDPKRYDALFRRCIDEADACDIMLAILDGADVDSGTAFLLGWARARGKTTIGLRTDYRPGPDHGVNLMCARACDYLVREPAFQEDPAAVAAAVIRRLRTIERKRAKASKHSGDTR